MTVEKPDRIIEESVVAKRTSSRAPSSHWLFLPDRRTLLDARQSSCEEVQNSRSETLLESHSAQIYVPLGTNGLHNSHSYQNRSRCMYHGFCNRGGCHVDAKDSTAVTTIPM